MYKKIGILEFDEEKMGVPCGKKEFLFMALAIISLLLFVFVIRIPGLEKDAAYAAGVLMFLAFMYICKAIHNGIVVIMGFIIVYLLKIMTIGDLFAQIGNSAVTMLLPMLLLAYAVTSTNIGQRIALHIVKRLGKSPKGLVFAFVVASTIISMFIINWPVIIMLTPIARSILIELGEEPGRRSKLGTALYAGILFGSGVGGAALVCGSSVNASILALIDTMTEGALTVSFTQWAIVGVPAAIITVPVCTWVINKVCGIRNDMDIKDIDPEYIEKEIAALGPVSLAEKRFLVTLVILIVLFFTTSITGLTMILCTMIAAVLCCLPGWGFINAKEGFAHAGWEVILVTIGVQLQGVLAIQTGLGEWLVNILVGWTSGKALFVLVFVAIAAYAIVTFLTTTIPYAIIIPGLIPLCAASGVTPLAPIMAIALVQSYFTHTPWHSAPQLVYADRYWEFSDFLKVGWITLFPYLVLIALETSLLCPIVFK